MQLVSATEDMAVTDAIFESQARDMRRLPRDFERERETQTSRSFYTFLETKQKLVESNVGEKNGKI